MAYSDQAMLAINPEFAARVRVGIIQGASWAIKQASTAQKDPDELKRKTNTYGEKMAALAISIFADGGESKVKAFSYALAADVSFFADNGNDALMLTTIKKLWEEIAGIRPWD
jgi:hypothetical protein